MASNTVIIILGILAILSYSAGSAWLAMGFIMAAVFYSTTGQGPVSIPTTITPTASQQGESFPHGPPLDDEDYTLAIASPCDGIGGSTLAPGGKSFTGDEFGEKASVGWRTGTATFDQGPIRIKDDLRINIDKLHSEAMAARGTPIPKASSFEDAMAINSSGQSFCGWLPGLQTFRLTLRQKKRHKYTDTALKQKTFDPVTYPSLEWAKYKGEQR